MNEIVAAALEQGGATEHGDSYSKTQPRLETDDPRCKWLNGVEAVAERRIANSAVEYQVYEVQNDQRPLP